MYSFIEFYSCYVARLASNLRPFCLCLPRLGLQYALPCLSIYCSKLEWKTLLSWLWPICFLLFSFTDTTQQVTKCTIVVSRIGDWVLGEKINYFSGTSLTSFCRRTELVEWRHVKERFLRSIYTVRSCQSSSGHLILTRLRIQSLLLLRERTEGLLESAGLQPVLEMQGNESKIDERRQLRQMKLHTWMKANSQVSFLPSLSPACHQKALFILGCVYSHCRKSDKKTSPRRPSDVLLYDPTQVDN